MPSVPIYIRQKDFERWLAIEDKPGFISNAINSIHSVQGTVTRVKEIIDSPWQEAGAKKEFIPKPPDPELGYSCCQKKSPCKHWHWDDVGMVWENELTGKTKADS